MQTKYNAQHCVCIEGQLEACRLPAGKKEGAGSLGYPEVENHPRSQVCTEGQHFKDIYLFVCLCAVGGNIPWYGCGSQTVNFKNQLLPLTVLGQDLPVLLLAAAPGAPGYSPTSAFYLVTAVTDSRCAPPHPHLAFNWVPGIDLRKSGLHGKKFCSLSHF
jgi:hypothetical protein